MSNRGFGLPAGTHVDAAARPGSPRPMPGLVLRRRLFGRLNQGVGCTVTLVSAPAGSGKTLLVSSWLEQAALPGPVAWVSVERAERDATRFWGAVVAALQAVGTARLEGLAAPPSGAGEEFVRRVAEGLRAGAAPVFLVLDDLHQLEAREAQNALAALLADPPAQLRLILLTRREPQLGLHRLRLRGGLTEIPARELEFTVEEAGELLSAAGVELSAEALARLCERTEGWAAGLRLAALSLAGRRDPERFVSEFSGSERTVAEYLVAEVLANQPPTVRQMLLRTSVLDRVNGPLAMLLGARPDAERLLQELEDANAFVTSLDAGRSWFRYHHLLADLLRLELRREAPHEVAPLHRAAAHWYAENGFSVEAIRHALAGQESPHAADLLMEHWFSLFLDGQQATIHGLLAALPAELVRSDAELAALAAADCLADGRLGEADAYLTLAERLAGSVPEPRRERFEVTLAVGRLTRARSRGNFDAAVASAHAILTPAPGETYADVVPNDDLRALALMSLGFVESWALRLDDAELHLQEGLALARRIPRPYVAIGCLGSWAHVANLRGRTEVAAERSREAIAMADQLGWAKEPIVGVAYLALGGGLLSSGRFEEAELWLDRAAQALGGLPDPDASVSLPFTYGVLRFGEGDYERALECFRAAEGSPERPRAPHFLSTSARTWQLRARTRLGDTGPARAALAEVGEAAHCLVEWCNLAAYVELADGDPEAALAALVPALDGSAATFHANIEIEALLLESLAHDRLGRPAAAERALERALDLAEPGGHVWIVLTVPEARGLLERHPRHRTAHGAFITTLLERVPSTVTPRRDGAADRSSESGRRKAHRAACALAAARSELATGASASATVLLAESPPLAGELDCAKLRRVRGSIEFARGKVNDISTMLEDGAVRLETLDIREARDTHLEALLEAIYAGALAGPRSLLETARAGLLAPPALSPPTVADVVLDAFALRFVEGHRAAAPKLREAIDVVRCVDDPQCMMFGCWAASELWDEESLGELARRWVELAREAGEPITLARALANRSAVWEVAVGRLDAAEASVDEARRVFAAVGALDVPERTDGARLIVAAWRGRDEEARALARSTMRGAIRRGRGASINLAYHGLAVLEIARGDYRAALALARKANEHDGAYLPNWTLPELVEAACRSGERDLAASAERRLADTVVAGSSEWGYGVLAQSRALRTEGAHAEALYREAIERLSNSRMRPQLARARLVYGEWLRRGRRRREAREQLTTAHELFDSMGMMGFAKRTAIELLATGERVGNPTGAPAKVLTPREAEIARRAAEGASNPDIAAQLYISQRTVEYHLHKVFRKLNITSRTQLARALVESSATDC